MSPDRWSQIEEIYHAALERPVGERAGFVERLCTGDPELRGEIEELLRIDVQAEGFLSSPSWKTTARPTGVKSVGDLQGRQIGHYEVLSLVGVGGMGEVYKARDTRLNRTVAIKVLPRPVGANPEHRKRFEREARAVSQLNHPHVCTLYDIGQHDGVDYLVMEYLEGETLARRLERGSLRLEDTLKVAIELGDALGKAHRQGVTHRDVKPGNVMLTRNGTKLLDFGLAKLKNPSALESTAPSAGDTGDGMIRGTLQYMAPEQLEGKDADARTDIFAFGVILYEMLSGRKAFYEKSPPGLIAEIMSAQPEPLSKLDPKTPPAVDRVVQRCLAKDPDDRWQTAHDLVAELRWIANGGGLGTLDRAASEPRKRGKLAMIISAALALSAGAAGAWLLLAPAAPEKPVIISSLLPPEGSAYDLVRAPSFIAWPMLSPDGKRIVFGARSPSKNATQLWVRELDSTTAQPLPGTEGASLPFWSPDSRYVGFTINAELSLKRIDVLGGPPVTITRLTSTLRGASWSPEGVIVYSQVGATVDGRSLLMKIADTGSEASPATSPEDKGPHRFPWFLPDGGHFLYVAQQRESANVVLVGSLDEPTSPGKMVAETETNVIYSRGYLLSVRKGTLMAQPFDVERLETTGEAVSLADRIPAFLQPLSAALFSASNSGLLVYSSRSGTDSRSSLVWKDRNGTPIGTLDPSVGRVQDIQLSPDRKSLVASLQETNILDLWIYDVAQRRRSRLTDNQEIEPNAVWTADGQTVIWRTGPGDLIRKAPTGGRDERLLQGPGLTPRGVSPDGETLLYTKAGADIWSLPLATLTPRAVVETAALEDFAQPSPDGKWIAFTSNESGRHEAYVVRYPGSGEKKQISAGGASHLRWRSDGRELFYVSPEGNLMAAEIVAHGGTLAVGRVHRLFGDIVPPPAVPSREMARPGGTSGYPYDVSLDGQSFIVVQHRVDTDEALTPALTLVENWTGLASTTR